MNEVKKSIPWTDKGCHSANVVLLSPWPWEPSSTHSVFLVPITLLWDSWMFGNHNFCIIPFIHVGSHALFSIEKRCNFQPDVWNIMNIGELAWHYNEQLISCMCLCVGLYISKYMVLLWNFFLLFFIFCPIHFMRTLSGDPYYDS